MKHILIVEGFRPGHEMLQTKACVLSMIIEKFRLSGNEKELYERVLGLKDNADLEEWIEGALFINKIHKIDMVVCFHEKRQYEAAVIAKTLGLSYYNSPETTKIICNKFLLRENLRKNKIDTTWSMPFNLIQNSNPPFPLIVKPVQGWGSAEILKVNNEVDLENIIRKKSDALDKYVAEEFLEGKEYSVESITSDGRHKIVCITEKFKDKNFVEEGHCVPANLPKEKINEIITYVKKILNNFEVKKGTSHTEIIYTKSGPHIVETHLRMGGDSIPDLIKNSFGIDMLDFWTDEIIGKKTFENIKEINEQNNFLYTAIWFLFSNSEIEGGEITKIIIPEKLQIAQNEGGSVKEVKLNYEVGEKIPKSVDSFSRLGYVINQGKTFEEAVSGANDFCESIKFEVKKDL